MVLLISQMSSNPSHSQNTQALFVVQEDLAPMRVTGNEDKRPIEWQENSLLHRALPSAVLGSQEVDL